MFGIPMVINETNFFCVFLKVNCVNSKACMRNAMLEPQLEFQSKTVNLMMGNKLLGNERVEEAPTYPTTSSSLIILNKYDKRMRPFKSQ